MFNPKCGVCDPVIAFGKAAQLSGLSTSALRKYESYGLVVFHRSPSKQRLVSFEDIERIKAIQDIIKEKHLNIEGILRLWALIPCWKIKGCSSAQKRSCPAPLNSIRPCWVTLHFSGCEDISKCADCDVYRISVNCIDEIKDLYLEFNLSEETPE